MAKQAVVDPFVTSKLTIGQYAWSLQTIYGGGSAAGGFSLNDKDGATEDLRAAEPALTGVVNGAPQYEIRLSTRRGEMLSLPMGAQAVSEEELVSLADEINSYIREMQDLSPELLSSS